MSLTGERIKETGKHAVIYGISNALTAAVGIVLIPLYTKYLSPAEYGTLSLVIITASVFQAIFALGMNSSLFRFYYEGDKEYRRRITGTATVIIVVSALALTAVGIPLSPLLSTVIFSTSEYSLHFMLMFLSTSMLLILNLPLLLLRAEKRSGEYSAINIVKFIVQLTSIIVFVAYFRMGILGVILGTLLTHTTFALFTMVYVRDLISFNYDTTVAGELLRFGTPLIFVNLSSMILTYFDQYLIGIYRNLWDVGIYNLGYKIGMVMNVLLIAPFYTIWAPMKYAVRKEKNADEYYRKILTYFLTVGLFLTVSISILSRDILTLIATPSYIEAYRIVPVILLSYLLYGLGWPIDLGISFEKKTEYIAYITALGAGLNIVLNIIFIPLYGIMGAAFTTLTSYGVMLVLKYHYNQKFYPIKYESRRIVHLSIVSAIIFALGWFINPPDLIVSIAYHLLLIALFPALLYATGFMSRSEVMELKKTIFTLVGWK